MFMDELIVLRPLQGSDLEQLIKLHNDPEVKTMAAMHQFPVSPELEKQWLESILMDKSNTRAYFGIEVKEQGILAGVCFLQSINWVDRTAWLGISLLPEFQGKGYGKSALRILLDYGYNKLNLMKISLYVLSVNATAIRMYEKSGFELEGALKQHCNVDGQRCDLLIMSRFKDK